MDYKKCLKNAENFYCENCDFYCSKQSNWEKHVLTSKHQKSYTGLQKMPKKCQKNAAFVCVCGNNYKYRQGLYKHRKTCCISHSGEYVSNINTLDLVENISKDKEGEFKELVLTGIRLFPAGISYSFKYTICPRLL